MWTIFEPLLDLLPCYGTASVLRFGFLAARHVDLTSPTSGQTCTPASEAWSLNRGTAREVAVTLLRNEIFSSFFFFMLDPCLVLDYE